MIILIILDLRGVDFYELHQILLRPCDYSGITIFFIFVNQIIVKFTYSETNNNIPPYLVRLLCDSQHLVDQHRR
jgi:hypothetical protein